MLAKTNIKHKLSVRRKKKPSHMLLPALSAALSAALFAAAAAAPATVSAAACRSEREKCDHDMFRCTLNLPGAALFGTSQIKSRHLTMAAGVRKSEHTF